MDRGLRCLHVCDYSESVGGFVAGLLSARRAVVRCLVEWTSRDEQVARLSIGGQRRLDGKRGLKTIWNRGFGRRDHFEVFIC